MISKGKIAMKKKLALLMTVWMIVICLFAGCGFSAKERDTFRDVQEYVLRVATTIDKNTPSGQTLLAINEEIQERTNGQLKLDIFWQSTAGGTGEIAEGIRIGSVDIGLLSSAVISNYTTSIDVFSLPFIISDRDQFRTVIQEHYDDVTAGIRESLGVPLGIWENGYRHLCTKDRKVERVEDCRGLTIRVMDGQVYSETFKLLGCIPSNIATGEVVPALQQGTIDGAEEPIAMIANQQQYAFCKYVIMIGYNYSILCPVMSDHVNEKIPSELMDVLMDVFEEYRLYPTDLGEQYEKDCLQICEENGMEITYPTDEAMADFKEKVKPVWIKYEDTIGEDLIELVSGEKEN